LTVELAHFERAAFVGARDRSDAENRAYCKERENQLFHDVSEIRPRAVGDESPLNAVGSLSSSELLY
jgi:hypothetical protein